MIFDAHGGNFIETREGHVLPIDIYVERVGIDATTPV
jgi:hypothetical protein